MAQILRNKVNPTTLTELTNLVKVCLKHNVCQFRGTAYQFLDGHPMGDPLSGSVSDVYMDNLEKQLLSTDLKRSRVRFWKRYIDDIFCLWEGTTEELTEFLVSMNQFPQNVKFTMELGGHTINFLDLMVSLHTRNHISTPHFEFFRKNTFTGVSIHHDSHHPRQHKMAVLHVAIRRLLSIPLDRKAHEHEVWYIEEIGKINGVKVNVQELIRRKSVRKLLSENRDYPPKKNQRKWVRLPYVSRENFLKNGEKLKRLDYRIAFYPVCKVAQLSTIKDPVPENQKAGIYEFRCGEYKAIYIGQTGRKLSTRAKEHIDAAHAQKPEKSVLAKHLYPFSARY